MKDIPYSPLLIPSIRLEEEKMKYYVSRNFRLCFVWTLALIFLAACGGSSSDGIATGSGSLRTLLTDSSTEDYQAVYVTIARVDVHSEHAGWQTVATPGKTCNLLALVNGVREELGLSTLSAGHYTQVRLILADTPEFKTNNILNHEHPFANYFINQSNRAHELKVPSGFRSGIKLIHGFDITAGETHELLLDFDAMKSVVRGRASGMHLLKPTIKVLHMRNSSTVSGLVSDGIVNLAGALVSAQSFSTDPALDAAEQVGIRRSTIAATDDDATPDDESGLYRLDLPAGDYNLVAYISGYQPVCNAVSLVADTPTEQDFTLMPVAMGTITGSVEISNAVTDQHLTIDFRRVGLCGDPEVQISVKTVRFTGIDSYSVELPVGDYIVVTSTMNETSMSAAVNVSEETPTIHNIGF
jgi:hypothetical protein